MRVVERREGRARGVKSALWSSHMRGSREPHPLPLLFATKMQAATVGRGGAAASPPREDTTAAAAAWRTKAAAARPSEQSASYWRTAQRRPQGEVPSSVPFAPAV